MFAIPSASAAAGHATGCAKQRTKGIRLRAAKSSRTSRSMATIRAERERAGKVAAAINW